MQPQQWNNVPVSALSPALSPTVTFSSGSPYSPFSSSFVSIGPASPTPAPAASGYVSADSAGYVSMASRSGQVMFSGNSAANAISSSDSAFRRIEELNHSAELLYKIARVAPASLFRKDRLKWRTSGGFWSKPKVCDDRTVNERRTMQLLTDMEVALDTVIAELSMVNKTLTGNVQFMVGLK